MPSLRQGEFEKAARSYKAKTGVGCDGFHLKLPLELSKGAAGDMVKFLEKLEHCWRWPQQACTTMFSFIPKNVTSERPVALQPTMHDSLVGSSAYARGFEVAAEVSCWVGCLMGET